MARRRCDQEFCPHWTGDGCVCVVLDIPPADRCPGCVTARTFGPSHDGSPRCESGSIASGGVHAHCTCDTCF